MNSPLGKYSQIVAAGAAIFVILAYIFACITDNVPAQQSLHDPFFFALAAVFTANVVTNGWKQVIQTQSQQVNAIHARLDQMSAPPAATPEPHIQTT